MDKKAQYRAARRVLDVACAMAARVDTARGSYTVRNRMEEIQLHEGYAEPGYSTDGIVATGNWNTIDRWNPETKEHDPISDLPKRVGDIFEKLGIEIEWSDEWSTCDQCYKLVRTSADGWSWKPSYVMGDGSITCEECTLEDPEEYLESLEGNEHGAVTLDVDPAEHGYVKVNQDAYESGWHPGQTDNPATVAKELRAKGIDRFLFVIDENSQFYTRWSCYVHEDEADLLKKE